MNWTISVPCWGKWHTDIFYKHALPSHLKMGLKDCKYILHVDETANFELARNILSGVCAVELRPLTSSSGPHHAYRCMNECHMNVMKKRENILFLPPDCVVSSNLRTEIEASGKKLVLLCSLRTLNGFDPPSDPKELNEWAVNHLHPNQKGWIWGNETGTTLIHAHVYFEEGGNFWAHA